MKIHVLYTVCNVQDTCDLDIRAYSNQTPLHLASSQGSTRCVECLVGYGADVGVEDDLGNTPLHFVVAKKNMKPLSQWTPHLNKVRVV